MEKYLKNFKPKKIKKKPITATKKKKSISYKKKPLDRKTLGQMRNQMNRFVIVVKKATSKKNKSNNNNDEQDDTFMNLDNGDKILDSSELILLNKNNKRTVTILRKRMEMRKPEYANLEKYLTNRSWSIMLEDEFKQDYFKSIKKRLMKETGTIYPPIQYTFEAFNACSFNDIKVIIVGQDPYHGPDQAHGLSFSVQKNIPTPPSLKNIFNELEDCIDGFKAPNHGCLHGWAKQGVLLLNTILTVRHKSPTSHSRIGWTSLTNQAIRILDKNHKHLVFMLWGRKAQQKEHVVTGLEHLILKSAHPSPYSVDGFYGQGHFKKCNDYLKKHNKKEINWSLF